MAIDFESSSSQFIDLGSRTHTSQHTICGWVTLESYSGYPPIYSAWVDPVPGSLVILIRVNNNGTVLYNIRQSDTTSKSITTATTLNTGTRYHFAFTADGTTLRAYFDGVVDSNTNTYDGTINGASVTTWIAKKDQTGIEYMDGIMEDVRRYNRALSQAEIDTVRNSGGNDSIVNGLTGRWLMNEKPTGSTASGSSSIIDISNTGNHGTQNGTPAYVESALKLVR